VTLGLREGDCKAFRNSTGMPGRLLPPDEPESNVPDPPELCKLSAGERLYEAPMVWVPDGVAQVLCSKDSRMRLRSAAAESARSREAVWSARDAARLCGSSENRSTGDREGVSLLLRSAVKEGELRWRVELEAEVEAPS
jgi:hypothetical protein